MLTGLVRYRKVEDATTAKDEPTQVYILEELVKAAETSPEDAQHIVEHLVKKTDSRNPVVKAKALRACKYLVQKGAKDAHRILQRNAAPIRQLQNYKGQPDPLKGDALNERVRTLAKEAVSAIFSPDAAPTATTTSATQNRIQGIGSQSMGMSSSNGSDLSSKMVGFGNERYNAVSSDRANGTLRTYQTTTTTFTTRRQSTSFLSDNPEVEVDNGYGRVQNTQPKTNVVGDEEQLVNNICLPSGVRSAPAAEDLRRFVDTAGSLDGKIIAEILHQKLESKNWLECYRALCAIETVILKGSSVSCGVIGVYFQGDLDIIRRCYKSQQKSIRERAKKILDIFKEVGDVEEKDSTSNGEDAPVLIDGVAEETQPQTAPMLDLLDDSLNGDATAVPTQSAMFDGLDVPPPEPVKTAPTTNVDTGAGFQASDMFSGLSLSNVSTPATKGSNQHLAALLAPSPAADPFPEARTPLKAETEKEQPSAVPVQPQGQYQMPIASMMPSYPMPQAPAMMGGAYTGQVPLAMPQQQPGGHQYPTAAQLQPGMHPGTYPSPGGYAYPNYMQPTQLQNFAQQGEGSRGEVPLSFFMGPAHVERRNSTGKANTAFSFVGDHISQLRDKK